MGVVIYGWFMCIEIGCVDPSIGSGVQKLGRSGDEGLEAGVTRYGRTGIDGDSMMRLQ